MEVSQQHNGISLAEAASALVTLQVPSKTLPPASVSSSKNGENEKPEINEVNPKDLRKKILEGMKNHFNTSTEEEGLSATEQSNRRGPLRSKSKSKHEDTDNDQDTAAVAEAVVVKIEAPKNPTGRGRGRPSKLSKALEAPKLLLNTLKGGNKVEIDRTKSEKDSGSEASSERSDSASGVSSIITTRRSQRTNISRTSASELLKGKKSSATTTADIEMVKPIELPRKRGRPCKSDPRVQKIIEAPSIQVSEESAPPLEDDVSKMEHMASLGLTIKSNQESSTYLSSHFLSEQYVI